MKISDRFIDYALVGGAFWVLQLVIALILGGGTRDLQLLKATFGTLPSGSLALSGIILLVIVVVTGMLLDLVAAAVFRPMEAWIMTDYLRAHEEWFAELVAENASYVKEDFAVLIGPRRNALFQWTQTMRMVAGDEFIFVPSRRPAYIRLTSFIFGYVLLGTGAEKMELLRFQTSLWNCSRAIATAFALSGAECLTLLIVSLSASPKSTLSSVAGLHHVFVLVVLIYGLLFPSYIMAQAAFGRFAATLFALLYVIHQREHRENVPNSTSANSDELRNKGVAGA